MTRDPKLDAIAREHAIREAFEHIIRHCIDLGGWPLLLVVQSADGDHHVMAAADTDDAGVIAMLQHAAEVVYRASHDHP